MSLSDKIFSLKPKSLLLLSVGAGLLAVLLTQFQIRQERGEAVTVYRATRSVEAGRTLRGQVEVVGLPGREYYPQLLSEAPTGEMQEFVETTPLRRPIGEGEIVLYRHLERSVDPGIHARIPPGRKAVSIPVDEASSVSYLVEPEDLVDVLGALPSGDPFDTELADRTTPVLEGVQVLAVGRRHRPLEPELRGRDPYSTVTLLVTSEEARRLTYIRDVLASPMSLVLRSPKDAAEEPSEAERSAS